MKKFLTKIVFTIMAIVTAMTISTWAGTADIQFSDPTPTRGKNFDLVIKIKSKDVRLANADMTIHYDPEKLEFVDGKECEGGSGLVRINGKGQGNGTTTLEFRLQFKALTAGKTQVTLQTYEVTDRNDNPVNIEHKGSSTVNVKSAGTTSKNANLKSLDVQPGELQQEFDQNIQEYTCEINSDVSEIAINAYPEESDAIVEIKGNENLKSGDNNVEIIVTAPNKANKKTYVIRVTKLETGVTPGGQSVADGHRFISNQYYVTYMDFPEGVQPFDGHVEGKAVVFNGEYQVWMEKGVEKPKYCIFYGMDQEGDVGYYRFDQEKFTLQRYFQDPATESLREKANQAYTAIEEYNDLSDKYNFLGIICICTGAFALILLIIIIVLLVKKGGKSGVESFKKKDELLDDDEDDDDFFAPKKDKFSRTKPNKAFNRDLPKDDDIYSDKNDFDEEDEYITDDKLNFNDTDEEIVDKKNENFEVEDLD